MIKKITYIIILIILSGHLAYADTQSGYIDYGNEQYAFKVGDDSVFLTNANKNFQLYEASQGEMDKNYYLQEAMRYYFLLSKIKPDSIDAQVGLGRVYDKMRIDNFAKSHFFDALNFDTKNGRTNYYFANFYYDRNDVITALFYYKVALANGYANDYTVNYRIGELLEKLADIESAIKYYSIALKLNSNNSENLSNKIRLLEDLNYSKSQYYLFSESGKRIKRDK